MNSTVLDDLTRENLALEAADRIKQIFDSNSRVTSLFIELLEVNLSVTAYIEESKYRLEALKLDLANKAKSSQQVVEILSENCETKMSDSPPSSKRTYTTYNTIKSLQETNDGTKHQRARTFMSWYKHMIDNEREKIPLYLADNIVFEWFGKTIKTQKKVNCFLKYDMQTSKHEFTTIESIEHLQSTQNRIRKENTVLVSPLQSPEVVSLKNRKRSFRCNSPEWAEGFQPEDEIGDIARKRSKLNDDNLSQNKINDYDFGDMIEPEISHKGDGIEHRGNKRKCVPVTPPNCELGQGDCLPSTSGANSSLSNRALNAPLPKYAVECNGYIQFTRSRNSRNIDTMKWERKFKIQISFSLNPINNGEYIVWEVRYMDDTKCRKNLLAAFEEIARQEGLSGT